MLFAYSLLLITRWVTRLNFFLEWTYQFYPGMMLLLEVAIHLRHLRNAALIREIRKHGGAEGQILYKKWFPFRNSANELYIHATLFLQFALLSYNLFFLGGALSCYTTAFKHARLSKKVKANSVQIVESKT